MGKTKKENTGNKKKENTGKKKKKTLSLKKEDMKWLSSNTQFDKEHIEQWHKVTISTVLKKKYI